MISYFFIFVIAIKQISSYQFRCPPPSQWRFRAAAICNSEVSKYVCLYDDNNHEYVERCEPTADFQPAGFKDVILGGLQSKECNSERYQPSKFWTNGSSDCIYEKSPCEEEGQITHNEGTTTSDRICRCDYTKGFAYVSTPENPCFCVPSKEDCSCFYKRCDSGLVLGPDYECFNISNWSGGFKCPDITQSSSEDQQTTENNVYTVIKDLKDDSQTSTSSTTVIAVIVCSTLLFFVIIVIYYLNKENKKRQRQKASLPKDDEESGIKSQQDSMIDQWEQEDKTFMMTEAVLSILTHLEKINDILITGPTGIGKSVILRHIALVYKHIHGYSVAICDNPHHLETLYSKDTKQIFVIDDICGKYSVNKNEMHDWERHKSTITRLLLQGNVKIVASCNNQLFKDKIFQRSLCFAKNEFDLTSVKHSLPPEQRTRIARQYLPDKIINKITLDSEKYPFLPLLCSLARQMPEEMAIDLFNDPVIHYTKELDSFLASKQNRPKCFALFLLVVYGGRLSNTLFRVDDNENAFFSVIKNSCEPFEIQLSTHLSENLRKGLNRLVGKYLTKDGSLFIVLHEAIFDILCKYFGNKFQKEFITNANISIIRERTQLESLGESSFQFTVMIRNEYEEIYFKRVLSNPNIDDIMSNSQMKFPRYRAKLISYIKNNIIKDPKLKSLLTLSSNRKQSPLHTACIEGYVELVQYILEFKKDLNADGCPYVFEACLHGHNKIAELLVEKGADVNKTSSSGTTPLMISCINKNEDMINYLIDKGADIYKPSNNGLSPLTAVSKYGDLKIFKQLLNKNIDINKTNGSGWTPLMIASENGHESIVNCLIENNANINTSDYNGQTALMKACIGGYKTIVDQLLKKHADVNLPDNNGWTPLSKSCQSGYIYISELLIVYGSNVNHCDNDGNTPLIKSCKYGHICITLLLLDKGAEIDKPSKLGGFTPLIVACDAGQNETVNILLKNKCDVNKSDYSKCTPIIVASRNGNLTIVQQLITEGADVCQADENGWTSLMKACEAGFLEIASLLIKKGAVIDRADIQGWTSLNKACKNKHIDIVNLLIQNKANVNKGSTSGWSPFMTACETDDITLIDTLIKNGADVNCGNNKGWTALLAACNRGNDSLVKYLILNGCRVNQPDDSKMTPIMIACENGHNQIVDFLIEKLADIHAVDKFKRTVLMIAYHHGNIDIVHVLAEKMADVDQKDYDGWTMIMKASKIGDNAMINFLLGHGANVNNCDVDGETCLIKASKGGFEKTVELLLDNNAECSKKDNKCWSALMWASEYGRKFVVNKLIQNGADVNDRDDNRWTGLMSACNRGYKDIVELLLSQDADPYITNNNGDNASDIARKGDRMEILSVLENFVNI